METLFTQIDGERIRLRKFVESDVENFFQYRANPAVALYQGWDALTFTYERAVRFVAEVKDFEPNIPGTWMQIAIALRESNTLIGDIGLHTLADDPDQMEIGITLEPLYQNQGYASEALECMLHYIFTVLEKHRIVARTDVRNVPSSRLMERLGLRKEGHFIQNAWYKGEYTDEYLFAMLYEEWMERRLTKDVTNERDGGENCVDWKCTKLSPRW